jgi:hypothetical protein
MDESIERNLLLEEVKLFRDELVTMRVANRDALGSDDMLEGLDLKNLRFWHKHLRDTIRTFGGSR